MKKVKEQIDNLEDIADMIVIRKGATNGEVMRTVFPYISVFPTGIEDEDYDGMVDIYGIGIDDEDETIFSLKWWDALYK